MKKLLFAVIIIVISAGIPVFAQDNQEENESGLYYVNVSLERIWPYNTGYVVMYRTGVNKFARAYIPSEWFQASGKGEIVSLPRGKSWPSMSVFYKNGEFSHVRIYVHRSPSHQTWGAIPQNVNIDSYFEGVEELKLQF